MSWEQDGYDYGLCYRMSMDCGNCTCDACFGFHIIVRLGVPPSSSILTACYFYSRYVCRMYLARFTFQTLYACVPALDISVDFPTSAGDFICNIGNQLVRMYLF